MQSPSNQIQIKTISDALAAEEIFLPPDSGQFEFFPADSSSTDFSSEGFEHKIKETISKHFPFSFLANVLLFYSDENQLSVNDDEYPIQNRFVCEIDLLLHQELDNLDLLLVVECKNQPVLVKDGENWFARYFSRDRNVQYQLTRQAKALRAFLKPMLGKRELRVEACVVSSDSMTPRITKRIDDGLTLHLMSAQVFDRVIGKLCPHPQSVVESGILRLLRLGIPVKELGHPELPNAVIYAESFRKSLDMQYAEFFDREIDKMPAQKSEKARFIYRVPFAIQAASLGLKFRWFASRGPKVIPSGADLEN